MKRYLYTLLVYPSLLFLMLTIKYEMVLFGVQIEKNNEGPLAYKQVQLKI